MLNLRTTLQAAIDLLPDAVIVVDQDAKMLAANLQVHSTFGYQPHELVGKKLSMLLPERFKKIHNEQFLEYLENPVKRRMGRADLALFGLQKCGDEIDIDVALAPAEISGKKIVMATIRDITALKELDRHLLKQNEELSLANTQLERLGYVIAHDLKSPLLNIHALLNLFKRELGSDLSPKLEGYTKALNDISQSMMCLITGVAEYSATSFQECIEEEIDLNEIVSEVRRLVHFPPQFKLLVQDNLPVINANKTKILQVFLNLVNNAVKYNDKPEGIIEIQASASNKVCLINIADNGPGVPEKLRGKVFELFRKGEVEKEGSQGIGLAVVKKIIEDRGGQILIEASHMGGANFVFNWLAQKPGQNPKKESGL